MKWPAHVSIRNQRWAIKLVDGRRLKGCLGLCDDGEKAIYIWKGLKEKARWITLLHELLHIAFFYGNGRSGTSLQVEHKLIGRIEEPLYEILANNFSFGED